MAGTAAGHWLGFGSGSGSAPVATLPVAAFATVSPGGGTVTLHWDALSTPGSGPVTYYVTRDGGDAAGDCPTEAAPAEVLTCTDSGLPLGAHTYTVTARWLSWTATSDPHTVAVTYGPLDHFVLSGDVALTAGVEASTPIQAVDAAGSTVVDYEGYKCLTFTGPHASPDGNTPAYPARDSCPAGQSSVYFSAGVALAHYTLYNAESVALNVSDGTHTAGAGLGVTVGPTGAVAFSVVNPGAQTAGIAFPVTIRAVDPFGNRATSYSGARCLVFSGPLASPDGTQPVYPAQGVGCNGGESSVTFTAGQATPSVTLYNPASTTLTVSEGTRTGTSTAFGVASGSPASFAVVPAGSPTAGTPLSVTLQAMDAYGNPNTSYTGAQCLAFSGPANSPNGTAPVYPAAGSCTGGRRSVTFGNGAATVSITLYNAAATTLTVGDGTMSGTSSSFAVAGSATVNGLQLTSSASSVVAGAQDDLTVTSTDPFGNTSSYTGNLNLTFLGAGTVAGSPYVASVADAGGVNRTFGTPGTFAFTNGVTSVQGAANGAALLYAGGDNVIRVTDGTHTSGNVTIAVTVQAKMVNAGSFHTCAVLTFGGVECWGRNNSGQLGDNTPTDQSTPVAVQGLQNVVTVNGGQFHTCALLADGTVWCWGRNNNGQLGDGTTTNRSTPVQVTGLSNVVSVSAGRIHTCAVRSDSSVWCWGDNQYGELGINSTADQHVPVQVHGVGNSGTLAAASVTAGMYHTCARTGSAVACWGRNNNGQIGDGTTAERDFPVAVSGISTAIAINSGMYDTCAVLANGTLSCWGDNRYGQIGDNSTTDRPTPVLVSGLTNVAAVSGGAYHTCALLTNGKPYCWGDNASGQVGDNSTAQREVPAAVGVIAAANQISGGGGTASVEHSVALVGGTVWTWGDNGYGQIGDGTHADRHVPVAVTLR